VELSSALEVLMGIDVIRNRDVGSRVQAVAQLRITDFPVTRCKTARNLSNSNDREIVRRQQM
jgi:hypothetical protein